MERNHEKMRLTVAGKSATTTCVKITVDNLKLDEFINIVICLMQ